MAKEITKKAGVSGNSVAGKSFQIFTVSEELLAKVVEAVQAGEKEARSSGNIQCAKSIPKMGMVVCKTAARPDET